MLTSTGSGPKLTPTKKFNEKNSVQVAFSATSRDSAQVFARVMGVDQTLVNAEFSNFKVAFLPTLFHSCFSTNY